MSTDERYPAYRFQCIHCGEEYDHQDTPCPECRGDIRPKPDPKPTPTKRTPKPTRRPK